MGGLLFRRQLVLMKIETDVGTDSVPIAATDSMLVRDVGITFDVQQLERPLALPDISNTPVRPGRKTATVTFAMEIKGSGVAGTAPKIGVPLMACGFAETELADDEGFEYDPVSSGFKSASIYVYLDGLLHKVTGARGSFSINATAGEYALVNFTFQGAYVDPVDASLPTTAVFEESLPPIVESAQLSVNGYADCAQQFTVDIANTINPKMCVNAAEGVQGYNLTGRNVTGSFNPEASLLATFNPFTQLKAGSIGNFTATIGTEDDNECVITGKTQYTNVSPGERDGALIWDIPVRFVREDGNDEIKIAFPQSGV